MAQPWWQTDDLSDRISNAIITMAESWKLIASEGSLVCSYVSRVLHFIIHCHTIVFFSISIGGIRGAKKE